MTLPALRIWLTATLALGTTSCSRITNDNPTAAGGVVLDWKVEPKIERSPASFGEPIGEGKVTTHSLTYHPGTAKFVERSGGVAKLTVRVEHGPIALTGPDAYAKSVIGVRRVEVKVDDASGWTVGGTCFQPSMLPIGASQGDTSTVTAIGCSLTFDFGWNNRLLPFDVAGDGKITMHPIQDEVDVVTP
jgi:hypothetical protein